MDRSDFLENFVAQQRPLRAYLHGVTGTLHETDDLFQNVWRVAWKKLDRYDEARPFGGWVFGIARLEALKWRQRKARSREILSEETISRLADTAVDDAETISLRHTFLLECLEQLQGTSRRVLEMKYFGDRKIREVARLLGKSVPAVEMVLVRVRRALRACIEEKMLQAGASKMRDRIERRCWDYLDGKADAAAVRQLDDLLKESDEARRTFLSITAMHNELTELLGPAESTGAEPVPNAVRPPKPARKAHPSFARWVPALVTAAALLALATSLGLWSILGPGRKTGQVSPVAQTKVQETPGPKQNVVIPDAEGYIVEATGEALLARAGSVEPPEVAAKDAQVFAGDTLTLGPLDHVRFAYQDGSELDIFSGSEVRFVETRAGNRLSLVRGAVDGSIRERTENTRLMIATGPLTIQVLGTEFRLIADSHAAAVAVRKGRVKVVRTADGKELILTRNRYAAVAGQWPFQPMDPTVCPFWRGASERATGTVYP